MGEYQREGHFANDADRKQRCDSKLDPRLRQLRVRNLLGQSFTVYVDLQEDVTRLSQLFALREGLPKLSHVMASLRFVYDGMVLQHDVPLYEYGIVHGSVIQTRICPRAWRGDPRDSSPDSVHDQAETFRERKSLWIKVPVTVTTPFGEATGALEVPEPYWPMCRLGPKMFHPVYCLTDAIGVNGAFAPGRGIYWQFRLDSYMSYPCMQPSHMTDVWKRLGSTVAHISIEAPGSLDLPRRRLLNEDESWSVASVDPSRAHEMHLCISLMHDSERTVADSTAMFREAEMAERREETCCICLEPMLPGEVCRRLPCLHRMHAGCCMLHLPAKPSCPVCRTSLTSASASPAQPLPVLPPTPEHRSSPSSRRARARTPSTPSTPTLPTLPRQSPGASISRHNRSGSAVRPLRRDTLEREPVPQREVHARSPVPRLVKVLSEGLKTIRARSWSGPRGPNAPQHR